MAPPIQISADEVNHIIYSYLQDSGFLHTAFTLRVEGRLEQSSHHNQHVPRGELIELLTKALLYIEVETHCKGDGLITDCKAPFSLLKRHECAVDLMEDSVGGTADKVEKLSVSNGVVPMDTALKRKASIAADGDALNRRVKRSVEPESVDTNTGPSRNSPESVPDERMSLERDASPMSLAPPITQSNGGRASRPKSLKEAGSSDDGTPVKAFISLPGSDSPVYVCAWNPAKSQVIATGTQDAMVRIYELPDPPDDPTQFAGEPEKPPIVLQHSSEAEQGDITALDWNPDGTLLATGSFDSVFRIWTVTGAFYMSHPQHQGPIFSARFSKSGRWVLSGSLDGTACVWDVAEKKLYMQFRCHGVECCLDAVWLDENVFATCGADGEIKVMRVGQQNPLLTLAGHQSEINALRFNPASTRLASCSDDKTVKVWDTAQALSSSDQTEKINVLTLDGHSDSIASLSWCPSRPEGAHEILATAGFEGSSYIWDTTTGKCLYVMHDHQQAAYALTFSPDGKFFATGSGDGWIYVYNVANGRKVWSYFAGSNAQNGIYSIDWQQSGKLNRIAACLGTGSVAVFDVTRIPALMDTK